METPTIRFAKPQYVKVRNSATGAIEPCYRFTISGNFELSDTMDRTLYASAADHFAHVLRDQSESFHFLIEEFLRCNSQYFAKKYTVESIIRGLSIQVEPIAQGTDGSADETVLAVFTPAEFTIHNGKIGLNWKLRYDAVLIDIPALDAETVAPDGHVTGTGETTRQPEPQPQPQPDASPEPTPTSFASQPAANQVCQPPPVLDATELESLYDIDEDNAATEIANAIAPDTHSYEGHSSRQYDKRRVKEARLRARLAQYKAERAMSRYLEKYGDEATDSEWSDSSSSGSESDSD